METAPTGRKCTCGVTESGDADLRVGLSGTPQAGSCDQVTPL